ncbi:MAG: TlpA family protein disulfide reductase, partial [Clostridia bacterium]|nr:TlpA family protein disulfide reductase [Clostridia bacterium]
NRLHQEYADKGFQIIGIVCDVGLSASGEYYDVSLYNDALDVVEMTGVTYKNLLPSYSLDRIKLREVYSIPETVFVDENGNVIGESYIGSRNYENWKAIVDSILATIS